MEAIEFAAITEDLALGQLMVELPLPAAQLIEQGLSQSGVLTATLPLVPVFEAYTRTFGSLLVELQPDVVLAGTDAELGLLLAELPAPTFSAAAGLPTPSVSLLLAALPVPAFEATGYTVTFGTLDAVLPLPGPVLIGPEGGALLADLSLPAFGASTQAPGLGDNFAIINQSPGFIWSYGAWEYELLQDQLEFSGSALDQLGVVLADQLLLGQSVDVSAAVRAAASDRFRLAAQITAGFRVLLGDSLSLTDAGSLTFEALAEVLDFLVLSETVSGRRDAIVLVTSGLALADLSIAADTALADDELALSEALDVRLQAAAVLVDALLLQEAASATTGFSAIVSDTLDLSDAVAVGAALIASVEDGFVVVGRLRLGEEDFIGYVCNTANRAFTTYTNFPFNSMANIGGRYFGAADDGLYLLEGTNDGGEAIRARARLALTNLGTGKQKRMPSAYIGYQGGRLVLKVITTSQTGEKEEFWYRIEARPAAATRESRIPIGRGLKSVYWAFELVNEGGDAFELDSLQLFPMILERRL